MGDPSVNHFAGWQKQTETDPKKSGNSQQNAANSSKTGDDKPKMIEVTKKRTWTIKTFRNLRKVQILGVGADMIDNWKDGWTKWLAEEVFKPFMDKKIPVDKTEEES